MYKWIIKAGVCSLSLVSSRWHPIITFQHFVIQLVWKNSRLLLLSSALYSDRDRHFAANHESLQRALVPVGCFRLCCPATGDVAHADWLLKRALCSKRASANNRVSAGDTVSRLESSWDGPVYSAAPFPAFGLVMNLLSKLDLKERETTNGIKHEPEQTAAVDLLPSGSHAAANVSSLAD